MPLIAVANQKGGVGKTTSTCAVGCAAAARGIRTLIIDNDPQGNASTGLGVTVDEFSTIDLYSENPSIGKAKRVFDQQGEVPNLEVIPTNIRLSNISREHYRVIGYFKSNVQRLREHYDLILIDTPPSFGTILDAALICADFVAIPLLPEPYSIVGLNDLLKNIDDCRSNWNSGLKIAGIFFSQSNKRMPRIEREQFELLKKHAGDLLLSTAITRSVRVIEAQQAQRSLENFAKDAQQVQQYRLLTEELLARMGLQPPINNCREKMDALL